MGLQKIEYLLFTASLALLNQTSLAKLEDGSTLKQYLASLAQNLDEATAKTELYETLVHGSMGNYLTIAEYNELMQQVLDSYGSELVFARQIGQTLENRAMMSYSIMLGAKESTWRDELKIRNSAMIDGVHHAREMTTVSQSVFSMLHLLHSYERGDQTTIDLLESSVVVYVPIVNVDGVAQIDEWYQSSGNLYSVRKNRRSTGRCAAVDQGVDLNRNYSFRFNYDD